jgi:tripartite-type tricarboxylate transporter receptor subunit TctC
MHRFVLIAVAAFVTNLATPARAQSVEEFYRGKSVNLLIGFGVGGGYDLYARVLARYIGKHIPGNPAIVPQNMTGAGSLRAAQFLYGAAPKDGLTFATFSRMAAITPLIDDKLAFDGTKFTWLGSISSDVTVCLTWHTSEVKTWKDYLEKPSVFGGAGPSAETDIFANLTRNVLGAKVRLAAGYRGTADMMLALERGEVDGLCGFAWTSLRAQRPHWIAEKKINVLVQKAMRKEADLPDVPRLIDLTDDREKQQILKLFVATHDFARPFAAPPGIPDDRKAALIAAFDATMKDPEFLAETKQRELEVEPVSAKALNAMITELYATPKDVLAKAAAAITR